MSEVYEPLVHEIRIIRRPDGSAMLGFIEGEPGRFRARFRNRNGHFEHVHRSGSRAVFPTVAAAAAALREVAARPGKTLSVSR